MGFPTIPKFWKAITWGAPIDAWLRVPMTWDDANWHPVVTPPPTKSVFIEDITFHSDGGNPLEVTLAYMVGGIFYELDRIRCQYEGSHVPYPIHLPCAADAIFCVRRSRGSDEVTFSARGYFLKGGGGMSRINTKYKPGWQYGGGA